MPLLLVSTTTTRTRHITWVDQGPCLYSLYLQQKQRHDINHELIKARVPSPGINNKKRKFSTCINVWEKKEETRLDPVTKVPIATAIQKSKVTTQKRHQNLDYTTIADQFRTDIKASYQTDVLINAVKLNSSSQFIIHYSGRIVNCNLFTIYYSIRCAVDLDQ